MHPVTHNLQFYGRADGVLNPSGVRFGSAEIYNVMEREFGKEVQDSLCVGQKRKSDVDERVMLFLLMRQGQVFSEALANRMKRTIREELSARHVPKFIFEVPDIPVSDIPQIHFSSLYFHFNCSHLPQLSPILKLTHPPPFSQTTTNLKKVELPVKRIVSGHIIQPSSTLLNPESLAFYYRFANVEDLGAEGEIESEIIRSTDKANRESKL